MMVQMGKCLLPILIRLCLLVLGVGEQLQDRMETSSPFVGLGAIRESWARTASLATDQQTASYFPHNSFVYFVNWVDLTSCGNQLIRRLPHIIADTLSATVLVRIAHKAAGQAYLWSPFAILACVSGSATPLHNLLVFLGTFAAARGRPLLAGVALASAAQLCPLSLLYVVGEVPLLAALCLPPGAIKATWQQGSAPLQHGKLGELADRAAAGQQAGCQAPEQGTEGAAESQNSEQSAAGCNAVWHDTDTDGDRLLKGNSSGRDGKKAEVKGLRQACASSGQSDATTTPATQSKGHGRIPGGGPTTPRQAVQRCAMFAVSLAGATAMVLVAEGVMETSMGPAALRVAAQRAQQGLFQCGTGPAAAGAAAAAASKVGPGISRLQFPFGWVTSGERPAASAGASAAVSASWLGAVGGPWRLAVQRWSQRLLFASSAADLHPSLGLQWYFFAEVFPRFRSFFLYWFTVAPAALSLPLVLRFPRQPLLCLLCQTITNCLLGPHPTYGDIALWLGLLPVAAPQLATMKGKGWWAVSFLAVLTLNSAAYQLWWVRGIVNANFLYGMNLAWAAWQVLFLVQLVKAAARVEVVEQHAQQGQ